MNTCIRIPLGTAAAAFCIMVATSAASAQIVLEPAPVAVTLDSLVRGAEVGVVNAGRNAVLLTSWRLDTFTRHGGNPLAGQTRDISGGLRVPARSRAVLVIDLDSTTAKAAEPGRYQSYLTVSYATGEVEAQVIATKQKPASTPTPQASSTIAPRPLARELTLHARDGLPGEFNGTVYVPAEQGTEVNPDTFVLTAEGSPPVLARLGKPRPWEKDSIRPEYPVILRHLRGGRTYKGRIYLSAGADTTSSAMTLNVHASHHIGFFLIAALVGVIAGLFVRRWTDLGRPISLLHERVLLALPVFRRTLAAHETSGWPPDRLGNEFIALQQATLAKVRALKPYIVKNEEVELEFTVVRQAVEALEARAPALAAVTAELRGLKGVYETLDARIDGMPPPFDGDVPVSPRPAPLLAAAATLAGTDLTLETLETARSGIAAQRAFLESWAKPFQEALVAREWLSRLGDPEAPEEEEPLASARTNLNRALWHLWNVADAASLAVSPGLVALGEVQTTLLAVAGLRARRKRAKAAEASADATGPQVAPWLAGTATDKVPAAPPVPWWIWWARRLRARRWLNDVALALAAFLVALLTTLSREYFGTAFGTLQDYMAVLTWAFGLTASLTLLTSGLASLQSTGLRPLLRR